MIALNQITDRLDVIEIIGNKERSIASVGTINEIPQGADNTLFWISEKNIEQLYSLSSGVVICPKNIDTNKLNTNCTYIIVENPRYGFLIIIKEFFSEKQKYLISENASIHGSVKLSEAVFIGNGVTIEKDCKIGDNVVIGHNTVICKGTIIGNDVTIGHNCTIGGIGFGYEKNRQGEYELIPHISNVVIENNVDIGNNTCIDRGVLSPTILKRNCKIDNLVHIAHGVIVGENSLIIANALIGGSTVIGSNVWVAPSATIINKIEVGNNSVIGMGAVVLKNVADNDIMIGNPAKKLDRK